MTKKHNRTEPKSGAADTLARFIPLVDDALKETEVNKYTAGLLSVHDDWTDGHICNEAAALKAGAILRRALDDPALDDSEWIGLAEDIRHALGGGLYLQRSKSDNAPNAAHTDTHGFICAVHGIKKIKGESIGPFRAHGDRPEDSTSYLEALPMLAQFFAERMGDVDSAESSTPGQLTGQSVESDEHSKPLTDHQIFVMRTMEQSDWDVLLGLKKICEAMPSPQRLSERTVGEIINDLIEYDYAERPGGGKSRSGAKLTSLGRRKLRTLQKFAS